jgi:hypothetical protein
MKTKACITPVVALLLLATLLAPFVWLAPEAQAQSLSANSATYVVLHNDTVTNTNGTGARCTHGTDGGYTSLAVQVKGIVTATINWEATIDGANYVAVPVTNINSGSAATTATADGLYRVTCTGITNLRARTSSWTSGTIDVAGWLVQ